MQAIEVKGVTKTYGEVTALRNISTSFGDHRIYGLLGRNGAGKSTLLKVIANRIFPDAGEVTVDGLPARENDAAQAKLYLMSEENLYPESMRVRDSFRWSKAFYPGFQEDKALALAQQFGLDIKKKTNTLSTGYQSIFKIITALSLDIPYLLFDEPVLGLDANHRELFYKLLLKAWGEKPKTIILATHLIEEVAHVIEHIVIVRQGEILRDEPVETLLESGYTVTGAAAAVDAFVHGRQSIGCDALGGLKTAYLLGDLPAELPQGLEVTRLDLQKLFIQLTNSERRV